MSYPRSMTGFGRGDHEEAGRSWTVEIKSVNHRFLDTKVKMSREFTALEERIKGQVAQAFSRAHVDVLITVTGSSSQDTRLEVNKNLARQYSNTLLELRKELGLNPDNDSLMPLVATFPEVISSVKLEEDAEQSWPQLQTALQAALAQSERMRQQEGANLCTDLLTRLEEFAAIVNDIAQHIPELVALRQANLKEKINKLLGEIDLDPMRLAQEVAILTDKADVTEELVRLQSHIDQFKHFLASNEPTGRKLDFLLQEFLREVNTLASKISNSSVAHQSVELKNIIEKLREQAQNLE